MQWIMAWVLENNPINPHELAIFRYVKNQSGNTDLAKTVMRFISLRAYLDSHTFSSSGELRKNIVSRGLPLFTKLESEQLFKLVSKKGGAEDVELADNIIRQWVNFIYSWTPAFLTDIEDSVTPYVFILRTLEYDETFGPLLGIALDSVTSILPVIATTIENLAPEIIGLLPIPEAGPVGAIIGWMVASQFVFLAMLIHISRQHFGQAFLISFSLVPFIGSSLYAAAMSGEKFLKKTASRRDRLLDTTRRLLGDVPADTLNILIPDPLAVPIEFKKHDIPSSITSTIGSLKQKASELGLPTSIEEAKAKASELGMPTSIEEAKAKLTQLGAPISLVTRGGKQLSRKKHRITKWRTQRRSKM